MDDIEIAKQKESPRVVRFVNLKENQTENMLEMHIKQRVPLTGKIDKIYLRKLKIRKLVYAFVVYELDLDAMNTVEKLNGTVCDDLTLDVALIGPGEQYKLYNEEIYCKLNQDTGTTSPGNKIESFSKRVRKLSRHWGIPENIGYFRNERRDYYEDQRFKQKRNRWWNDDDGSPKRRRF